MLPDRPRACIARCLLSSILLKNTKKKDEDDVEDFEAVLEPPGFYKSAVALAGTFFIWKYLHAELQESEERIMQQEGFLSMVDSSGVLRRLGSLVNNSWTACD